MFGANILAQFVRDRRAVEAYLVRLQPPVIVVMDDLKWAHELKAMLPTTAVIYRGYHRDDQQWHDGHLPYEIWAIHKPYTEGGLIAQIWNEPSGYGNIGALIHRAAEVVRMASADGRRVIVPNWGVGHPDLDLIARGGVDELIAAWYDCPEQLIGVHEYAQDMPSHEQKTRIGRFTALLDRANKIGKPLDFRQIIVTEYGRDVAGGEYDGYRAVMTDEQYALFLADGAALYHWHSIGGACPFAIGAGGGGRWRSFDYEGVQAVYSMTESFNADHPTTITIPAIPDTDDPCWQPYIVRSTGLVTNVRKEPNTRAEIVGRIGGGGQVASLAFNASVNQTDGEWIPIRLLTCVTGWIRRNVVKTDPISLTTP